MDTISGFFASIMAKPLAPVVRKLIETQLKRLLKSDVFLSNYSGAADIRTSDGNQLRSEHSYTKTEIEFDNRLPESVDIYWINHEGGPKKYCTLRPNQTRIFATFVTHPWIVEKESNAEEVRRIIVDASIGRVIIAEE